MTQLSGPDVSHHQGTVDWKAVKAAGHSFAFMKATEGGTFTDSLFAQNIAGAKAAGLVPGAYHFLRSEADPLVQARHYVDVVNASGGFKGVLAALDVETSAAKTYPTIAHVRAFAAEFKRLVPNHTLIIYTGAWYWRDRIGDPQGADIGPLWHSAYTRTPGPLYGGWKSFTFWQWTSSATSAGISGRCDMSWFYGDMAALLALAGVSGVQLEPLPSINTTDDDEDEMFIFSYPGQPVRVRDGAGVIGFKNPAEYNAFVNAHTEAGKRIPYVPCQGLAQYQLYSKVG